MKKVFLIKITIVIFILSLLVSCSIGKFIYPEIKPFEIVITPELNKVSSCNLGEAIIKVGKGHYSEGVLIKSQARASNVFYPLACQINEGFYEFIKKEGIYSYYFPTKKNQIIDYTSDNMYLMELRISDDAKVTAVREYGDVYASDEFSNISYEKVDSYFVLKNDSFQQTMVYIGKVDNIIKFSYREFYKNRIRDSFTTDITYDLSESNIIGYKGFKAEIIKATNSKLTYKLISEF